MHPLHQVLYDNIRSSHSPVRLLVFLKNTETRCETHMRLGAWFSLCRDAHVDCGADIRGIRDQVRCAFDGKGRVVCTEELDY